VLRLYVEVENTGSDVKYAPIVSYRYYAMTWVSNYLGLLYNDNDNVQRTYDG